MPTTPAILSFTPPGGVLLTSDAIRIQFNRTMDTGSCTTTGSIGAATATWSTTVYPDDTVTFTGAWTPGIEKYFEVSGCESPDALTVGSQYRIWSVYAPGRVRYVRAGASALNDGLTAATPIPDLQTAIDALNPCGSQCAVLVYDGTYSTASPIQMQNEVSLFGGYESNFSARRPGDYDSVLTRTTCSDPCITLVAGLSVGSTTIIEGFRVQGGSSVVSTVAMLANGCPTIQTNDLRGGSGTSSSTGLRLYGACLTTIQWNVIRGGDSAGSAVGIDVPGSSPILLDSNYIFGGVSATSSGTGIMLSDGSSTQKIVNNLIVAGPSDTSIGIEALGTGGPQIHHNTIVAGDAVSTAAHGIITKIALQVYSNNILAKGASAYCVYEGVALTPAALKLERNNLWSCPVLLRDDDSTDETTLAGLVAAGYTADNYRLTPVFLNPTGNDYRFTDSSPCLLTQGGHPGPLYAEDGWGSSRPGADGFTSVGAYEHDGTCAP